MAKGKFTGHRGFGGKTGARLRGKAVRGPRDLSYMKPKRFADYKSLSETALEVGVDPTWLIKLEQRERIPRAARVRLGSLQARLWSPAQVEEIRAIIKGHKVGRPKEN